MKTKQFLIVLILLTLSKTVYSQEYPTIKTTHPRILIDSDRFNIINNTSNGRLDYLLTGTHGILVDSWKINYWLNGGNGVGYQNNYINLNNNNYSEWEFKFNATNTIQIRGEAISTLKYILILKAKYSSVENQILQNDRINFITEKFIEHIVNFYAKFGENGLIYPPPPFDPEGNTGGNYQGSRFEKDFEWGFRSIAEFGAILLDWGYDSIDEGLRNDLVSKLWDFNYTYMQHWVYDKYFGPQTYKNDGYYIGHAFKNNLENMRLILALYGDSSLTLDKQTALRVRYHFLYNNFNNQFLPIYRYYATDDNNDGNYDDNKGGDSTSATYAHFDTFAYLEYFNLISKATDKNLFIDEPWVNSTGNRYFYLIRPDEFSLHQGDDLLNRSTSWDRDIITLFNNYSTDNNKWLMKQYQNDNTQSMLDEIIFRNFDLDSSFPESNPAPLDWYSRKSGFSISKKSWNPNATMVTLFNSATNRHNHQHLDNNSFQIFKNGPLFIDSGNYDSYNTPHYLNYYSRTIAHNTITVYAPSEKFYFGDDKLSNDGGQYIKTHLTNISSILESHETNFDKAWLKYYKSEDYIYQITDASNSYISDKVESYRKKFLYLKPLDRIIMLDYIKQPCTPENALTVRWNAHFKEKPIVLDENDNPDNPDSTDMITAKTTKIERFTNSQKYIVSNGTGGEATIKTLYPKKNDIDVKLVGTTIDSDTDVNKIQGCTYIYENDDTQGEIYPINISSASANRTDGAKWRLEESFKINRKWSLFLNTIDIGNQDSTDNNSKLLSVTDKSIGLKWDNTIYIFNENYTNVETNLHKIKLDKLESGNYRLLAFDLKPNRNYKIRVDLGNCQNIYSNSEGIIDTSFNFNGIGYYLFISPFCIGKPIGIKDPIIKPFFKLYPNSVKKGGNLTISVGNVKNKNIDLKILNLSGNVIFSKSYKSNKIILSNIDLKKGVYFIKLTNLGIQKKLIIR